MDSGSPANMIKNNIPFALYSHIILYCGISNTHYASSFDEDIVFFHLGKKHFFFFENRVN